MQCQECLEPIFERFQSQHEQKLWHPAVEPGTCKVILGMQVKRQCGIKKSPVFTLDAFTPAAKPAKNVPGIPLH